MLTASGRLNAFQCLSARLTKAATREQVSREVREEGTLRGSGECSSSPPSDGTDPATPVTLMPSHVVTKAVLTAEDFSYASVHPTFDSCTQR